MKTKVLLVDDHPIVRQGLVQLINQQADLTVCWAGEEAGKAFAAVGVAQPDILVVDISLKSGSGLELIKNVKATYPDLPALVLSMHDELLYAERALRAGARGYIMKQEAIDRVLVAIRRVLEGELYLSDEMKKRMLHQFVNGQAQLPASPVERLSDRELEVFRLIGLGHGTRQIAEELHLSVKTVETHRAHVMDKMRLRTAHELALRAFQWVHHESAG